MPAPQQKQPDQKRIVEFLAQDSKVPIEDVATLYEHERSALAAGARVTSFIHIFAIRNVQEILRDRADERGSSIDSRFPLQ